MELLMIYLNHPVQILSDIFTIKEKLGGIEGVKVAYVGDGNNVAYSWMMGASLMGMHLVIACPKSCQPHPAPSLDGKGKVEIVEDPFEAVQNADIIYTDVWISMGEKDAVTKKQLLLPYQINQKLVDYLSRAPHRRHGCLVLDFITPDLARAVYKLNFTPNK